MIAQTDFQTDVLAYSLIGSLKSAIEQTPVKNPIWIKIVHSQVNI